MAAQLGVPGHEASQIKRAYLKTMVGLADFQQSVSMRSEVKTWGGRIIPVQPPKYNEDGSVWTFNYKLVNHLIQGTAADQTKESIIRHDEDPNKVGRFPQKPAECLDSSCQLAESDGIEGRAAD